MDVDIRLMLIAAWIALALVGIVMGVIAVKYAKGNRDYAMSHDTNEKQRITTRATLIRVVVLAVAALAIFVLGLQSLFPIYPAAVRQWVGIIILFYLAVAVDLVLANELVENHKLRKAQQEEEQAKNGEVS